MHVTITCPVVSLTSPHTTQHYLYPFMSPTHYHTVYYLTSKYNTLTTAACLFTSTSTRYLNAYTHATYMLHSFRPLIALHKSLYQTPCTPRHTWCTFVQPHTQTYRQFEKSWSMVARPLSINHLGQQKLLECFAVSEHTGVFELGSKRGYGTTFCYSNLVEKNAVIVQ